MTLDCTTLLNVSVIAGFIHTLAGPDHYLPLIALSKSRNWSYSKTVIITFLCGLGHILSAFLLGALAVKIGLSVERLNIFESWRGDLAGWLLVIFGIFYMTWGFRFAVKDKGAVAANDGNLAVWVLFVIFVLGPCEPLIPIVVYASLHQTIGSVLLSAGLFGLATIITMLSVVSLSYFGLKSLRLERFDRFSHALTGLIIALCGMGMQFLGL